MAKKKIATLPDPPTGNKHTAWNDCCCAEIDPDDIPCVVCESKDMARLDLGLPTEYKWSKEELT